MHFLEIAVREPSYHGRSFLTYRSESSLKPGTIVTVPIKKRQVLGIVVSSVPKPNFRLKAIIKVSGKPSLPEESVTLLRWICEYYASPIGPTTQLFLPSRIPESSSISERPYSPLLPMNKLPPLTTDQVKAQNIISRPGMYLLHGDTGTGKTRVYIELASRSIHQNRSVLVLTPEIGLTSQLARDFVRIFGKDVFVIHSKMTASQRQKIWLTIALQRTTYVIIGPRSALFCPLHNIGLIVVDEAHETAYKQEQTPYYHAVRVAGKLADLHKATLVLGSATPLVADYYFAQQKRRPIVRMTQTAADASQHKRQVSIVDLRDQANFSRKAHISDALLGAIEATLSRKEQLLLFLNRRGTARIVICSQCSWQARCPSCDLGLVYHGDIHAMRCHSCNFKTQLPTSCPQCHHTDIVLKSIGTKAIAEEVQSAFPEARLMRFDADNKKAERIEEHYEALREGKVDILVGTQMIAKGLDLPKLSLVGIINADTSLYFPDFSANERTYQLLSQVVGRVGRGHRQSQAIIQTYNPGSPALQSVLSNDWESFYNNETQERSRFLFPPFCHLLQLSCRRASMRSSQSTADRLIKHLSKQGYRIILEGPTPCFHEKIDNKYQWQIVVKSKQRPELLKVINALPSGWTYNIDPINLL
ncbi:MAG TPA: primosomal protein N' [Candidatus Saccharimonadales bacterium]|nr:primosomal protein N' [Candidatus Saccharimonadales bacterium]